MKSVLITGGTTRLGLSIAEQLRAEGWRVLTSSHRFDAGADIVADLSEPTGAAKLYASAMRILDGQPPDAIVNNACLYVGEDSTIEAIGFTAAKKLIMLMAGRETVNRGVVVNILDTKALVPIIAGDPESAYLRTKRALRDYTIAAALTYADTLRVNAVAPGPVLAPTQVHEAAGELLVKRPSVTDVAAAVSYLLGAEATTGCVIPVDGGQALLKDEDCGE